MRSLASDRGHSCACASGAGLTVVTGHQLLLSSGGIDVVHAEARGPGLFSLNKEGLLSLPVRLPSATAPAWLGNTCFRNFLFSLGPPLVGCHDRHC